MLGNFVGVSPAGKFQGRLKSVLAISAAGFITCNGAIAHTQPSMPMCKSVMGTNNVPLTIQRTYIQSDAKAGEMRTTEIGRPILQSMDTGEYISTAELAEDITYKGAGPTEGFDVYIPAGTLVAYEDDPAINLYQATTGVVSYKGKKINARVGIGIKPDPTKPPRIWWARPAQAFLAVGWDHYADNAPTAKLTTFNCGGPSKQNLRREIIYSGSAGSTVSLLYREYTNDMARSAFSQPLTYDLKSGTEVGYKGARLRVVKATNTDITVEILKPME